MKVLEKISLSLLKKIEPELAHNIVIKILQLRIIGNYQQFTSPRIKTEIAGIQFSNPIGLAAGFDKNGSALNGLSKIGFGFLEIGAVTPIAQKGNPKPRLFRLDRDGAIINRLGFNNNGMMRVATKLKSRPSGLILGLNIGANKHSKNRVLDFANVLKHCGNFIDFATINVSSPNTKNLRRLQNSDTLSDIMKNIEIIRLNSLEKKLPIFLKISPDLSKDAVKEIADVALKNDIAAIIATNSTIERSNLKGEHSLQLGGLSGKPLFEKSTRILAHLYQALDRKIPLIGVGGITNGQDAYEKILAGASAIQIYTALVFKGFSLVNNIAKELDFLIQKDGYENISEAVGSRNSDWL